jgi:two-component system response regulator YesN
MFRILIVEDDRIYRELLKDIISEGKFPGVIVEEAENGREAMEKADSFRPNLFFMDIGLPDESGLQLTNRIKTKYPDVNVAILTSHDEIMYREAAIRYGASHYLIKADVTREKIQNLVKSFLI